MLVNPQEIEKKNQTSRIFYDFTLGNVLFQELISRTVLWHAEAC